MELRFSNVRVTIYRWCLRSQQQVRNNEHDETYNLITSICLLLLSFCFL